MSTAHPSILRVLGWRLLAVSLVFLALIVYSLQSRIRGAAETLFHQALEQEARGLAANLKIGAEGKLRLDSPKPPQGFSSIIPYRILDDRGHVLFASPGLMPAVSQLLSAGGAPESVSSTPDQIGFFMLGPPQLTDRVMGASLPTDVGDKRVYIEVFEDLDQRGVLVDDLVEQFFVEVGWLVIPFVGLLFLTNIVTIWTQLRPLTVLSRMAAEIGPETLGRRLPEDGQPKEILPLVRSVNRAFERLDQGFQVQRQFTADAAHELRTPLAVLSAHIDTLADKPSAAALRLEIAAMSRLVGQLLRIAELDGLEFAPSDPVDLHVLAVDVASSLAPLALKQGKSIALTGAPAAVWVRGDSEALHHALRNLVENALAHTPKGTTVEIELVAPGSIAVSDSGGGVTPELRSKIFQRFFRIDRRKDGAGLGLAIVAKVAETHGGRVRVEDAPGGGARFVLELPSAQPPPLDPDRERLETKSRQIA